MERVSSKAGQLAPNTDHVESVGHTLDELKPAQTQALPAEIAPLPSRELLNFLGGSRVSEQIRLHVPEAANPFQSSPSGPKHDYFLLQRVIQRSNSDIANAIVTRLQLPSSDLSEQSMAFMRASLAREHNMLELLKSLTDSMGRVHNRVVGSQEG